MFISKMKMKYGLMTDSGLVRLSAVLYGVVLQFPTRAPEIVVSLYRFSELARNLERRCNIIN